MTRLLGRLSAAAIAAALVVPALSQYSGALLPPASISKGFNSIAVGDAKDWLGTLASKEFAGRGTGQPGYQKAAEYVASKLKGWGIKPMGDNGTYFQGVPINFVRIKPESISVEAGLVTLNSKDVAFSGSDSIDTKGNIAVVRTTNKDATIVDGGSLSGHVVLIAAPMDGDLARRLNTLGAAAILRVANTLPRNDWMIGREGGRRTSRANGYISLDAAKRLAEAAGIDSSLVDVSQGAEEVKIQRSTTEAILKADVESSERTVPNVVGMIEGSDPVLKNEVVCIGAHLDHLGESNGVIYYGADDDASGSTAVLLIARAFSLNPVKPKRSVMFLWFAAEEIGLIGSRYYVNNPVMPLDKTTCLLQLDMIGRNEERDGQRPEDNVDTIKLIGSKRISMELHDTIIDANKYLNLVFEYDEEDVYTRSDHYNFAQKGVPVAFLFSGFHPDYHRPTDTPDKINYEKVVSAARLAYVVADTAANRKTMFRREAGG